MAPRPKPRPKPAHPSEAPRRAAGFAAAGVILGARIRAAGEARGFAVTRLLTRWAEVVGEGTASLGRPLSVRQARGRGATLTILAQPATGLRLQMESEAIRARVNACYGYEAVAKLRIVQAAPGEGAPAPVAAPVPAPVTPAALDAARGVGDTELRLALAALAANVLRDRPTG